MPAEGRPWPSDDYDEEDPDDDDYPNSSLSTPSGLVMYVLLAFLFGLAASRAWDWTFWYENGWECEKRWKCGSGMTRNKNVPKKNNFKTDSYLHCGDHLPWKPPNKHAGVSCRHLNVNYNWPSSSPSPSTPSPPLRTSSRPTSSSSAYLRQRWGACSHWKTRVQWRALSGQPWWPCILQCGNRRWPDWEEGVSEQLKLSFEEEKGSGDALSKLNRLEMKRVVWVSVWQWGSIVGGLQEKTMVVKTKNSFLGWALWAGHDDVEMDIVSACSETM